MSVAVPQRRATWHEAYDTQMDIWRWLRTDGGVRWIGKAYEVALRDMSDDVADKNRDLMQKIYAAEEGKMLSADPVFVSAEMCEVIDAARHGFDPEALLPTDLLTTHGFVYLEKPLLLLDRYDNEMRVAAFSWAPILGNATDVAAMDAADDKLGWLQARDYSGIDALLNSDDEPDADAPIDGIGIAIYTATSDVTREQWPSSLPAILPMHFAPWWFGMSFGGNEVDLNNKPTGAGWWWKLAQTTLRLMQQRIAVHHAVRPDRASRREAKRRGFDDREVVVVRLRRERTTGENEGVGANANYSHRFIVSGHWRNQWYPSGAVHRQIWISPYVKGPDELPLIVRPRRVYTWDR